MLASTEDAWSAILTEAGGRYVPPKLVLFTGSFPTACAYGTSGCRPARSMSADAKVYIDLRFYDLLRNVFSDGRLWAGGKAYVIAHEVGHHVQNLLGCIRRCRRNAAVSRKSLQRVVRSPRAAGGLLRRRVGERTERSKRILEPGDIEEAIKARASSVTIVQKQTQSHVVPDSFTHGTSAQRVRWLRQDWRPVT